MEIKVPFYNIVNIFIPGLVLLGSCVLLFINEVKPLIQSITNLGSTGLEVLVTVSLFAIAYEIGYILFRLGSAFMQPIFEKSPKWSEYSDIIAAKKTSKQAYESLEVLSREYGYARTQITLFIVLVIMTGIRAQWWFMVICIFCVVLFAFTAYKHMIKTQKTVKQYLVPDDAKNSL